MLAAGYATRLYPLTQDRPKPLLPIAGRPILDYLLEKIEKVESIDEVFLVTNDKFAGSFRDWTRNRKYSRKIEVVNDGTTSNEDRLGAIGDLHFVIQKFRLDGQDIGVFAGDNLFRANLKPFVVFAQSHRPHASLGIVDVRNRELACQYGIVRVDGENRIAEFLEKPKDPPSTLASTGVYWFPKESLDLLDRYMREGHNADRPGDYIHWLIQVDRVYAYRLEGKWFDIGDLDSYREADEMILKEGENLKNQERTR